MTAPRTARTSRLSAALGWSLRGLAVTTLALTTLALAPACSPPAAPVEATTTLQIGGMVCESCSQALTAALAKQPGVRAVTVDHVSGKAEVVHDPALADRDALVATVTALGYTAR